MLLTWRQLFPDKTGYVNFKYTLAFTACFCNLVSSNGVWTTRNLACYQNTFFFIPFRMSFNASTLGFSHDVWGANAKAKTMYISYRGEWTKQRTLTQGIAVHVLCETQSWYWPLSYRGLSCVMFFELASHKQRKFSDVSNAITLISDPSNDVCFS